MGRILGDRSDWRHDPPPRLMPELAFSIPGEPPTQGSMRAMRTKRGGVVVFHANAERLADYRADVGRIVAELWNGRPSLDFPVSIAADFYLPRPLEHYEARNPNRPLRPGREALSPKRPDLDKAARALGDALVTASLLADDAFIAELHLSKRYAAPWARPHTAVLIRWPLR